MGGEKLWMCIVNILVTRIVLDVTHYRYIASEFINYQSSESIEQVDRAVYKTIDFYNNKRPHRSLNMLTPREAADWLGGNPQTVDQL
jgi:transposase InsO family protein